jgi:hypothetical protein
MGLTQAKQKGVMMRVLNQSERNQLLASIRNMTMKTSSVLTLLAALCLTTTTATAVRADGFSGYSSKQGTIQRHSTANGRRWGRFPSWMRQPIDSWTASRAAARERLLGCMIREDHPDSTYLFHEGDAAHGVYLVLEGQVEIVRAAGTHEKILDSIVPGDYFGEVAVLDGFGRSTAARARGVISVARILRTALLEVLAAEPGATTLELFQHVRPTYARRTT